MPPDKPAPSHSDTNISIGGDVNGDVIVGDNIVVNKPTIIQKIFNIFASDAETLEQRNRRILLNHVENAWIKGVLDASLYGAAMLDLGIKNSPESVTDKYPWAIKKESTDETLPVGTSMLEIFDSIGMGRSLLILGAPGSGKTTMLLELTRGLIARAREDVTQPIPMVFNLASWTEKFTLADWLAQELNNLYSVPRKTAPDWVKGNKLLLLLDGLDEVRQESRSKCVEAINEFRKQNGLTSLAVCSRSQDYADLKAKLSFEGAIEVQPLTQKQITEFFNRFGKEMTGIKQVLKKDNALREMAETPLFLSIMIMAYRDKQDVEILVSEDAKVQHKQLFDTFIQYMFERPRFINASFTKQSVLQWLSWLAGKMIKHKEIPYVLENTQPDWLIQKKQINKFRLIFRLLCVLIGGLIGGLAGGLMGGLIGGLWGELKNELGNKTMDTLRVFPPLWLMSKVLFGLNGGLVVGYIYQTTYPGQRLILTARNFFAMSFMLVLSMGLSGKIGGVLSGELSGKVIFWLIITMVVVVGGGLVHGGLALIRHYTVRFILARNNLLPWRLVPFLDHCVDLIFLRRVGGGYIFVHRLLMEHFAEMYKENNA